MKANTSVALRVLREVANVAAMPVWSEHGELLLTAKAESYHEVYKRARALGAALSNASHIVEERTLGGHRIVVKIDEQREIVFTIYTGQADMHISFVDAGASFH